MAVFIDSFKKSLGLSVKNWTLFPLIALYDFLFLFLFGVAISFFKKLSAGPIVAIIQEIKTLSSDIVTLGAEGKSAILVLLSDSIIVKNLYSLIGTSLIFAAVTYLLWVVFEGSGWNLSYKISGSKNNCSDFIKKFSVISLFWFVVLIIIIILIILLILFALLRPDQLLSSSIITNTANVIFFILIYFALISLSVIDGRLMENFKKTFKLGIFKILTFIAVLAVICIALYLNFQITYLLFKPLVNNMSMVLAWTIIIVRFAIAVPFLAWARIYMILVSKSLHR